MPRGWRARWSRRQMRRWSSVADHSTSSSGMVVDEIGLRVGSPLFFPSKLQTHVRVRAIGVRGIRCQDWLLLLRERWWVGEWMTPTSRWRTGPGGRKCIVVDIVCYPAWVVSELPSTESLSSSSVGRAAGAGGGGAKTGTVVRGCCRSGV